MEQARNNMEKAASELDFIKAAKYRDEMAAFQELIVSRSR
jgi:excinuclease UvrABC nuclease subunit